MPPAGHMRFAWLAGFLFLADRILKWLVLRAPERELFFLRDTAGFGYWINPKLMALALPPFLAFGVALAALVLFFIFAVEQRLEFPPTVFILAGGASNLADRALYLGVIDFARIGNATVNLADVSIWIGLFFFFFSSFRKVRDRA